MASVRKRKRKDGSMFYEIQVSRGRGLSPYTMRWDRPEGLAEKTIQSQLRTVAVNFENDCKAGKVKTRKEEKEAAELEREEREKAEKDKVTFRRFCNESFLPAIRARASQTSAYNYELQLKKHIFPVLGGLEMTEIRAGDINQLLRQILAEGKSDAVAVKTYTIIRSVMKMAYADELIERNPMERVDRPHKRKQNGEAGDVKSCTAEELRRLCEALREEPYLWQVLVRLLIDSGLRIGECVGLLWENLNFEKNMICVNGALKYTPDKGIVRSSTKNGKSRSFGVDPEVMEMLRVLRDRQAFSRESAYVFVNEKTGLPLHPDSPRRFIKQLGEKCGIKGLHPHMLRHSFASVAITNGADIASVSEKLGHSDKAVTLRMYTHADEASISRASDIFREAIKNKKNMEDNDGRTDG